MPVDISLFHQTFDKLRSAVVITDTDNRIVYANLATLVLSGYSKEELLGQDPKIFSSGIHDEFFYQKMWEALSSNGSWSGEIWDRRKDGSVYAKNMDIHTLNIGDDLFYLAIASEASRFDEKQATGMLNQVEFVQKLAFELKRAIRAGELIAVLSISPIRDRLPVNDQNVAEAFEMEFAARLSRHIRTTDIVAKCSDGSFLVMYYNIGTPELAWMVSNKLRGYINERLVFAEHEMVPSSQIGIALFPEDAIQADALIQLARDARQQSELSSGSVCVFANDSLNKSTLRKVTLHTDLQVAVRENQFLIYYQPIVELATQKIVKAEALVRWNHPEYGIVSPAIFIPLAEETGLINEIGRWVLEEVSTQIHTWNTQHGINMQVSVNVSPIQLNGPTEDDWVNHLAKIAVNGQQIVLEVTEGSLLDDSEQVAAKLFEYRGAKMQVAIDDFGTGYSALSYLKKFQVDYIKIDKSFVDAIDRDTKDAAICDAIIAMAHKLQLAVIAEGIETESQKEVLLKAGCDYGQGYLFSKPLPIEQFHALVLANATS
ncbi:MAG: EAL domain-containing protein [Gallionella sp.]|nr:EAL domain-containing protein [Gallionella sp.]